MDVIILEGECSLFSSFDGNFSLSSIEQGEAGNFIEVHTDIQYTGSYDLTASAERQVIHTKNLVMYDDLVIEPIPSNYGLVSWNGLGIRVS